ncbi:MAG: hypothetical protein BGN86_01810 [Caulobacterales bacterium 68-7]|nr:helix-turn-helix transcriptional regulator [Caulobacterales bacterium]OJU09677.1 MAG: hypothetical protein BGN86_01810 [Caulobacterales bacterium 68-7]
MADSPHPVDVHVGRQIRLRRKAIGLTQHAIAERLGLTFQQVQKYERGHNRVSASKLFEIANALQTDVGYFFQGMSSHNSAPPTHEDRAIAEFASSDFGRELILALNGVPARNVRRGMLALAKALADPSDL